MKKMWNRSSIKNRLIIVLPTIFSLVLLGIYLYGFETMTGCSGDALDVWKCITTYHTPDRYASYVLYKGFLTIYPYVWWYDLAMFMGCDEFLFVKIYHCVLFSVISTIEFPYIIKYFYKKNIESWRILIFVVASFWLWRPNYALSEVMIDLPQLAFFLGAVCLALSLNYGEKRTMSLYIRVLCIGLLLGLLLTTAGQYVIAVGCIIIYCFFILKNNKVIKWMCSYLCLVFGVIIPNIFNIYFAKYVTQPLVDAGGWIPSAAVWQKIRIISSMTELKLGSGMALPDVRGTSLLMSEFGTENFDIILQQIQNGLIMYTKGEYILFFLKHPLDFLICYFEKFFMALCLSDGYLSFGRLMITFTILFFAIVMIKDRIRFFSDIFKIDNMILAAFLAAAIPACIVRLEIRYVMQLNGIVFAFVIMGDKMYNCIYHGAMMIKGMLNRIKQKEKYNIEIPYIFVGYLVFIFICFAYMACIIDLSGSGVDRLIRW